MRFLAIGVVLVGLLVIVLLIRKGHFKHKYAIFWALFGVVILVLAIFPELLSWVSSMLGVQVPSNFLFAALIALLVVLTLQLSYELSVTEERLRKNIEETAMLKLEVQKLKNQK